MCYNIVTCCFCSFSETTLKIVLKSKYKFTKNFSRENTKFKMLANFLLDMSICMTMHFILTDQVTDYVCINMKLF